jgi:hypothetical protein
MTRPMREWPWWPIILIAFGVFLFLIRGEN